MKIKYTPYGFVTRQVLSDKSVVFDLVLTHNVFNCLSEKKAVECLHEIKLALEKAVVNPDAIKT